METQKVRHVLKISDLSKEEFLAVLAKSMDLKAHPCKYATALKDKTLLMLFQKPSLRTRVSFETGMTQMGGHAIFYSIADSPLGVKETYSDTGKVLSRFVDVVMARVNKKEDVTQLAAHSTIPIINALDDWAHPLQMLADMQTIAEKRGGFECFKTLKMAYCGDVRNNVTYDLMRAASVLGFEIRVAGPTEPGFGIHQEVLDECAALNAKSGGKVIVCKTAEEAVTGVDVVYADSWMSYGIPKDQMDARIAKFMPFQINEALMKHAKIDAIFMNCLPAARGMEQTAEVIDGPRSVVFDEAENRLHTCKALMLWQLRVGGFEACCDCKCEVKTCCQTGTCKTSECCKKNECCKDCSCEGEKKKSKGRILVALGGNALLQAGEKGFYEEAQRNTRITCLQLAHLIEEGYELVITHGNGPQVGAIKLQNQIAAKDVPEMPLFVCGAESQGYLGFLMQQTLGNILKEKGITNTVVCVVTQVRVDAEDPAFQKPTKPIGRFYTKEEAEVLKAQGKTVVEDSGRGYRVVVASPQPKEIVEGPAIKTLLASGAVVISTGGGGIPVISKNGQLEGCEAVIDKDLGGALLGRIIEADKFVILTDVDGAYLNYRDKEKRQRLPKLTVAEAQDLWDKGEFAAGSMGPKVKAGIQFAKTSGKQTVIASLDKLVEAINGTSGTLICP